MPSKTWVTVYSTTRNKSQNSRFMGQYLNKSCLLSLPWLRIRTTAAEVRNWRKPSSLSRRNSCFFPDGHSSTLPFREILCSFYPSCFAVLALNHHSYMSSSNDLKLFLRVLIWFLIYLEVDDTQFRFACETS